MQLHRLPQTIRHPRLRAAGLLLVLSGLCVPNQAPASSTPSARLPFLAHYVLNHHSGGQGAGLAPEETHTLTLLHQRADGPWYLLLDEPELHEGSVVPGSGEGCPVLAKGKLEGAVVQAVDADHAPRTDGRFQARLVPGGLRLERADVISSCGVGAHVLGDYRQLVSSSTPPSPAKP
ncbi:hypothetical protein [Oecophyllibacter saccharovorans]|uniref:Uncharacterized protein n=1 Tax=Oecophyllibacter saccharovorans TaxID=2558360 RepID=A0A506URW3_9PROT|nr:hypothetical protein [Oecophyllibacter saccharovorans]TPW36096.1 hypothetical protein E3202_04170 [Oecophyllibacter saccharovorans]